MVFLRDAAGVITWASPSTRATLGFEPEAIVGTNTLDFVHPDDLPLALAVRAQVGPGDQARGVAARLRRADGTYRYMSLATQPLLDESGTVTGAVGEVKDVDDLVRARMQVEHERTLLRASTDSMLDPQVLLQAVRDASGRIVDFTHVALNRGACEYLDRSAKAMLGTRLLETLPGLAGRPACSPVMSRSWRPAFRTSSRASSTAASSSGRTATTTSAGCGPVRTCSA